MRNRRRTTALLAAAFLGITPAASARTLTTTTRTLSAVLTPVRAGCAVVVSNRAHCYAQLLANPDGTPHATAGPSGYGPADLRSAYKLPSTGGSGQTIAIVDAYDNPKAEADLAVYRSQFGLPPCTTANGCFRKVNQTGGTTPPAGDTGWGLEISLDLDMASAVCPNCKLLLVEANSNANTDLYTAVDTAARLGATEISNSYGGGESSSQTTSGDPHFNHPGVAITVSSGDSGYGVEYPAASQYVTAVGGTTLKPASNGRGWTETVWSGSGSGCSRYDVKPSWQHDSGCAKRTVADVAAVADPNTGVAVYDTYSDVFGGASGWITVGGTSASAPIIAGVYALAGNAATVTYASYPYSHATGLFDVTSGSNGGGGLLGLFGCSNYLCNGAAGYDGPTGLGTPNGTTAF